MPDALYVPNQVIQSLWRTAKEASPEQDVTQLIDDFPRVVEAHFRGVVDSEGGLKEVLWSILITRSQFTFGKIHSPRTSHALGSIPERSLVRMRLMVQDNSTSPEIYLAQQPNGLPGGWAMEHPSTPTADADQAQPALVPGDVDYSKLRERHVLWAVQVPGESHWPSRLLDGEAEPPAETTAANQEAPFYAYKSPNGEVGLQLKIYGQAPKLSPTDVATFVGVLDREPYAGNQQHDSPSVPTIHVVYWHPNPVTLLQESEFPLSESTNSDLQADWQALVDWIAEALGGDLDAAKWVALCVASGG
ncbi:hypothetical protein FRC06_007082, partial [Ceratobasidium sp. 370]